MSRHPWFPPAVSSASASCRTPHWAEDFSPALWVTSTTACRRHPSIAAATCGIRDRRESGLVEQVRLAADLGVTSAQVALAWVHHRQQVWGLPVVPIPGTKRVHWLEQNVAALDVRLPSEALDRLDGLAAQAVGDRHPQIGLTSAGGRA